MLVTITQADIAQLAGSSRESASRFLAVLERAGVVTQGRGRVTVHEPVGAGALRLLMAEPRSAPSEFSAGGVVVRGDRVRGHRADTPRRQRREGPGAAQGPRRPGRDAGAGRRRARSARRPASTPSPVGDARGRPLLVHAQRQAHRQAGRLLPVRPTSAATSPTTTTRSSRPAGCRSARPRRPDLRRRAGDGGPRPVADQLRRVVSDAGCRS